MRAILPASALGLMALVFACGSGDDSDPTNGSSGSSGSSGMSSSGTSGSSGTGTGPTTPAAATCEAAGGSATVAAPTLLRKLVEQNAREGWLASPAVADLDGDRSPETIAARGGRVVVWGADGAFKWQFDTGKDRIWASPVVANFSGDEKLEIAVAARDSAWIIDASGAALSGFPQTFGTSETRSLAAGDLDGDGALDIAVAVRNRQGGTDDIVKAYRANGTAVAGFPPNASGASGCTDDAPCYYAGQYDQNIAIGLLDTTSAPKQGVVVPHDNAYATFFHGDGRVYDSNAMFRKRPKTGGVRYLHDLPLAQQGFADDEAVSNQAHFTNTPPAIADIDGDGSPEIVMVGSVQNASQDDRLRGVGLWVLKSDASRLAGWESPFHVPAYVMGLNDGFSPGLGDDAVAGAGNLVGLTNQVTVANIDAKPGNEMIFAGYDGKIHAVAADKTELWTFDYATSGRALTPGLVVADLSADGVPEIAFTTYSPDAGKGALVVLSSSGQKLHEVALPGRGSMAVPTIADADGDGTLDMVVALKDATDAKEGVFVFQVPGSKPNCIGWATGRANLLRNGWLPAPR